MKPRGLRNNNPLNIRHNSDKFQGEIKGNDKSFKTFSSMPYGYRAGFVVLHTYLKNGFNTIEKIIARFAPPNENNTQAYIANVERWSGVPRSKELTAASGADYIMIVTAISGTLTLEYKTETNIKEIKNENRQAVAFYTITGIKLHTKPQSGIFIVLYDDGTSEKVMKP